MPGRRRYRQALRHARWPAHRGRQHHARCRRASSCRDRPIGLRQVYPVQHHRRSDRRLRGQVRVDGELVTGPHRSIGMVFQEESTFPWRNVLDNVAFPLEIAGVPKAERHERARHFVPLVGLDGFERRYPAELSGGMRQRVAMARTLAAQPKILLMDEPFAALDEQTRLLLGDKVLQIQQKLKQTTLIITHNITEAVQLSDRVLVMTYRPGRLKRLVEIDLPRPRTSRSSPARPSATTWRRSGAICAKRRRRVCSTKKRAARGVGGEP